jgi:hypothetical protein
MQRNQNQWIPDDPANAQPRPSTPRLLQVAHEARDTATHFDPAEAGRGIQFCCGTARSEDTEDDRGLTCIAPHPAFGSMTNWWFPMAGRRKGCEDPPSPGTPDMCPSCLAASKCPVTPSVISPKGSADPSLDGDVSGSPCGRALRDSRRCFVAVSPLRNRHGSSIIHNSFKAPARTLRTWQRPPSESKNRALILAGARAATDIPFPRGTHPLSSSLLYTGREKCACTPAAPRPPQNPGSPPGAGSLAAPLSRCRSSSPTPPAVDQTPHSLPTQSMYPLHTITRGTEADA